MHILSEQTTTYSAINKLHKTVHSINAPLNYFKGKYDRGPVPKPGFCGEKFVLFFRGRRSGGSIEAESESQGQACPSYRIAE